MTRQSPSDEMIAELVAGHDWLFSNSAARRLLTALRANLQSITHNIYIFHSFPEQYEDIYDVLIDGVTVVRIEVPRREQDGEVAFEKWNVDEYLRRKLPKLDRRKLLLAIELARGR